MVAVHESGVGPSRTSGEVGFCAAIGSTADLVRALTAARVYEYTP